MCRYCGLCVGVISVFRCSFYEVLVSESFSFLFRLATTSAPTVSWQLLKRCAGTARYRYCTLCACDDAECCVQCFSRCFLGEQQRPCCCRMPSRRLHPAQPQADLAAPRALSLRLRRTRGVAGRGAAAAAQRRCGQLGQLDAGARVFAEGESG